MTTTVYTVVFLCRNYYIYITSQFVNNCRTSQLQLYSPNLTGAVRTRSDRLGAVDVFAGDVCSVVSPTSFVSSTSFVSVAVAGVAIAVG